MMKEDVTREVVKEEEEVVEEEVEWRDLGVNG